MPNDDEEKGNKRCRREVDPARTHAAGGARFWLGIFMLTTAGFSLELVYSVEACYAVPALLETGLQETYASVLWAAGPVIGLLFQSFLGAASDRCTCSWGKRRPFVLGLAISVAFNTALFAFGRPLFLLLGGTRLAFLSMAVTFIGMDFSLDQFGSAARMYLLDSVSVETSDTANTMYITMLSLGSFVGSLISAVNWDGLGIAGHMVHHVHHTDDLYKGSLEYQLQAVFGLSLLVFVLCVVLVLRSVDERPQRKKSKNSESSVLSSCESSRCSSPYRYKPGALDYKLTIQHNGTIRDSSTHSYSVPNGILHEEIKGIPDKVSQQPHQLFPWNLLKSIGHSVRRSGEFLSCVSVSMKLLWAMAFLDWITYLGKNIFFSNYVGTVVYGGSPTSDDDDIMSRYEAGVRMACWCRVLEDGCAIFYCLILDRLSELVGHKALLVGGHVLHFLTLGVTILQPSIASVTLLCITDCILVVNLETIPYDLILYYKESGTLLNKPWPHRSDTKGKAVSLFCTSMMLAQVVDALTLGALIDASGSSAVLMLVIFMATGLGGFMSLFVRTSRHSVD